MRYALTNNLNRGMLNHFFNEATYDRFLETPRTAFSPRVDIFEREDLFVIEADLPGVSEKDIEIKYNDGVLTLKGEKKFENLDECDNYYRRERVGGAFERSFKFKSIDEKNIKANFKDGVLRVSVPLKEEAKPKKISIAVN